MAELWNRVDALVDRAPALADLRAHRVHLLAARRWRDTGREVPAELVDDERLAAVRVLAAPALLERVRAAYDGPLVLLKGPEVAASYPDPLLRPFVDLDLLVPDGADAYRKLEEAGFKPMDTWAPHVRDFHLRPLVLPGFPLRIELHTRPRWIDGLPLPGDLFSAAVASRCGVDGMLALPAPHHAMILAAHSWAHEPLRRALDLIDIAALVQGCEREELRAVARSYGLDRVWRTTERAMEALLGDGRRPWPLRLWARNLSAMRERTVLEFHLARWLSDFWALPAGAALARTAPRFARELRPEPEEPWRRKIVRAQLAVRNARRARSQHERDLERSRA